MKKHLSNFDERIIMLFVGDKREVVTSEVDAVDYLLFKLAKIEQQLIQSNQNNNIGPIFNNNTNPIMSQPHIYQPGEEGYTPNRMDPNS